MTCRPLPYLPQGSPIPFDHYGEITRRVNNNCDPMSAGDFDMNVSSFSTHGLTTKRRYSSKYYLVIDDLRKDMSVEDTEWHDSGDTVFKDDWLWTWAIPWSFSRAQNCLFIEESDDDPSRYVKIHFPYLPIWATDAIKPATTQITWYDPTTNDIWKDAQEKFPQAIVDAFQEPVTGRLVSQTRGTISDRYYAKVLETFPRAGCTDSQPCLVTSIINPWLPDANNCLQPVLDIDLQPVEVEVDWVGDHVIPVDTLVEIQSSNTVSGFEVTRCICDPCLYDQLAQDKV